MVLISERFDLDETVPEPNAPRCMTPKSCGSCREGSPS